MLGRRVVLVDKGYVGTSGTLPTISPFYRFDVNDEGQTVYNALRGPEYVRALRHAALDAGVTILDCRRRAGDRGRRGDRSPLLHRGARPRREPRHARALGHPGRASRSGTPAADRRSRRRVDEAGTPPRLEGHTCLS
jgi:hypothetical protein